MASPIKTPLVPPSPLYLVNSFTWLDMIPPGKVGHLGGSSSIMDIVAALYFKVMHVYADPQDPRRDRLILSRGTRCFLSQYAAFVELGYVEREARFSTSRPWTARFKVIRIWIIRPGSRRLPVPWDRGCPFVWAWRSAAHGWQ